MPVCVWQGRWDGTVGTFRPVWTHRFGVPAVRRGRACILVTGAFMFKATFCFSQVTLADHTPYCFQNSRT